MFALGLRYLTGYVTATDAADYESAEWPPHPARVFMALVAAHHEGNINNPDPAERAALEWLEALPPPAIACGGIHERRLVTQFVPVGDTICPPNKSPEALRKTLPGVCGIPRSRQERTFPKVRLHDESVFLIWPDENALVHSRALTELCAKVTRIGHSSSFVQMWVEPKPPEPTFQPTTEGGELNLRIPTSGLLLRLEEAYNLKSIEDYFDLFGQIVTAKGKLKKELQIKMKDIFDSKVPNRFFPSVSSTCLYTSIAKPSITAIAQGVFDPELLILAKLDGPVLGLEATARLSAALRGAILHYCAPTGGPEWLTGHTLDGKKAETPHIACLPLSFVGHAHADGHLLGMAIAFPRAVSPRERGRAIAPLLYKDGVPVELKLTLGNLGTWTLGREERPQAPYALRSDTWCKASEEWATVTPVVIDRHLKSKTPSDRFEELCDSILHCCSLAGLPIPTEISVDKNAFLCGAPRAAPDKSGFPLFSPSRFQTHVYLRFPTPVEGPVIIGAGRYRGYGLFKPFRVESI